MPALQLENSEPWFSTSTRSNSSCCRLARSLGLCSDMATVLLKRMATHAKNRFHIAHENQSRAFLYAILYNAAQNY